MISLATVTLTDPVGEHPPLGVRIYATQHQVFLQPAGYGESEAAKGYGIPLFLDLFSGQLRLVAFPDINNAEPVIIPLDRARESLRQSKPN